MSKSSLKSSLNSLADHLSDQLVARINEITRERLGLKGTKIVARPKPRVRKVPVTGKEFNPGSAPFPDMENVGPDLFEVADDGRKIEGRRVDIDSAIVRKLRRGEYLLDGSIDLHGLDATTARDKLEAFLKLSRSRGERTLLVIHGRGKNSPGGRAILRGEIVSWLSQGHESALVSAFSTALPDDGGDGAMYVRLR